MSADLSAESGHEEQIALAVAYWMLVGVVLAFGGLVVLGLSAARRLGRAPRNSNRERETR